MDHQDLHESPSRRAPRVPRLGRRFAAVAGAFASIAVLAVAPAALTAPAASAKAPLPIDVGSYNIRAGVSTGAFESGVRSVTSQSDLVGLQEVNSKPKKAVLESLRGWNYWRSTYAVGGEQSPVLWKTDRFRMLDARVVKVAGPRYIGNEDPKRGTYTHPCFVTLVHLRDLSSGDVLSVINVHLPPGAVVSGQPVPTRPRIFRAFRATVVGTGKLVSAEQAVNRRVFVLGDFNIGWVADKRVGRYNMPYKLFGRRGLQSMWATDRPTGGVGSHLDSPALIDQVYSATMASTARVDYDTTVSDHFPVLARYDGGS